MSIVDHRTAHTYYLLKHFFLHLHIRRVLSINLNTQRIDGVREYASTSIHTNFQDHFQHAHKDQVTFSVNYITDVGGTSNRVNPFPSVVFCLPRKVVRDGDLYS